jgi:hypothetical protein
VLTMTVTTGSMTPSTPITPSKQQNSARCTTASFYVMLSTTKTMVLLMTSTSSHQPTPQYLVLEQSITFRHSLDVSERSDTRKISSQPLKNMTVALTRLSGSRCTTLPLGRQEAMKTTWQDTFLS